MFYYHSWKNEEREPYQNVLQMFSVSWGGPQKVFIHTLLNYECIALDEYQTKYYLQYVKYKYLFFIPFSDLVKCLIICNTYYTIEIYF